MNSRRHFLLSVLTIAASSLPRLAQGASPYSASGRRRVLFENFQSLKRWRALNNPPRLVSNTQPSLARNIGNRPGSCLKLANASSPYSYSPGTLVELLDFEFTDGTIELDAYIVEPALLDVCFRCDFNNVTGYVARLETRSDIYKDTFVDMSPWVAFGSGTTITPLGQWIRMRIAADGPKLSMYKDGVQVLNVTNATTYTKGSVGLFSEGGTIYVDNLRITSR